MTEQPTPAAANDPAAPQHPAAPHPVAQHPAAPHHPAQGAHTPALAAGSVPPPWVGYAAAGTAEAATVRPRRRRLRIAAIASVAALALVAGGGGTVFAVQAAQRSGGTGSASAPWQGGPGGGISGSGTSGSPYGSNGGGTTQQGQAGTGSTASDATTATDAQQVGVVTIVSTVGYDEGEAAGTGMILTTDGEILTNNHVVEGATSIEVTVESTGRSYTADVVGTDATDDVAVLQLEDASGLTPIDLSDDAAEVGDTITDVGNAGGTGTLVAADGTVTALDQQITVQDDLTGADKTLSGLLQLDADIQSGDSGGPVLDEDGDVVGIATAASSGSAQVTGFAIPIATAERIVAQIESGTESGNVTLGLPAFLGVQLATASGSSGTGRGTLGGAAGSSGTSTGVAIAGVIDGSGAEAAGLAAGDTITAVAGTAVADSDAVSTVIAAHDPGDRIAVTYTDAAGASHTVTVTLGEGPAA